MSLQVGVLMYSVVVGFSRVYKLVSCMAMQPHALAVVSVRVFHAVDYACVYGIIVFSLV